MSYIRKTKRILFTAALAAALLVSLSVQAGAAAAAAAQAPGKAVLSVEAFTVGGGFIFRPTEVTIGGTITISDILNDNMGRSEINFGGGAGRRLDNFAISSRENDFMRVHPDIINALYKEDQTNQKRILGLAHALYRGWIINGDYTIVDENLSDSRWLIIVNNKLQNSAPDAYRPANGDVVRIAFSVAGDGSDLAIGGANAVFSEANRDDLYKRIAAHFAAGGAVPDYFIMGTASDPASSQNDINRALRFMEEDDDLYDILHPPNGDIYYPPGENGENGYNGENGDDIIITTTPPNTTTPPLNTTPQNTSPPPTQTTPKPTGGNNNNSEPAPTGVNLLGLLPFAGVAGILTLITRKNKK